MQSSRVSKMVPPNQLLCMWSEACLINPHFDVGFRAYSASDDFVSDIQRIASWFSVPRLATKARVLKPEEDAAPASGRGSRSAGPLLPDDKRREFLNMVEPTQLDFLMRCGDVHRRFTAMGLRPPTGTTMVEQGFRALGLLLFERAQTLLSEDAFARHAMLATLALNFAIFRKEEKVFLNCDDNRVLQLLEAAYERMSVAEGVGYAVGSDAERMFRACVSGLQSAEDTEPVSARECDVLLPLSGGVDE